MLVVDKKGNSVGKKWIHTLSEVPSGPHFAIFEANSIYVPGDERSRQYPGHGYPASTEYFLSYVAFDTKEEWASAIQERLTRNKDDKFIAVQVIPAQIETKVVVNIATPDTPHVFTQICPKCGLKAESIFRDCVATRECTNGHNWLPAEDKQ